MNKAMLIILDGFGIGPDPHADAIFQANTPCYDHLMSSRPHSILITHGLDVGLPQGQMGNSEVGHMNLGAGRVVYQDLTRIDLAIRDNILKDQKSIVEMIDYAVLNDKPIHLIGLVSDGGVHSHINHLLALIDIFENSLVKNIYIHFITDGRDTDPHSGKKHLITVSDFIRNKKSKLASIIGRYYAMDRDKRWERTQLAYNLYCNNLGSKFADPLIAIEQSYAENVTDEFVKPIQLLNSENESFPPVQSGDVVYCFNFRSDRLRQLTNVLTQFNTPDYNMKTLNLNYYTMTEYDESYKNIGIVFPKITLSQPLGEVLSVYGVTQLRIAETEKYPHVTFFFNCGRETPFSGERRIMIPSPKVATYDLKPSMSAVELTEALIQDIKEHRPEFICLNFANTDMVGHTGVFKAGIKAAETVDQCLQKILDQIKYFSYEIIILADHGNVDCMINPDGSPNTSHTKNPVPCILISESNYKLKNGRLCDIAPTLLNLMNLPIPSVMTGENLLLSE
ncbi:MAG: 2,3-bisphosphoglycerate-independent phosphoglycerate mutase [Saprospiraceae bacterium]